LASSTTAEIETWPTHGHRPAFDPGFLDGVGRRIGLFADRQHDGRHLEVWKMTGQIGRRRRQRCSQQTDRNTHPLPEPNEPL
jgi:hypothetical protein